MLERAATAAQRHRALAGDSPRGAHAEKFGDRTFSVEVRKRKKPVRVSRRAVWAGNTRGRVAWAPCSRSSCKGRNAGRKKKLDPSKERLEAHGGRRRPCPGRDACLPLNFDGKIVLFPPKDNGEAAAQAAKKRRSKPGLTARPPGRAVIRLKTPHQPEGDFGGQCRLGPGRTKLPGLRNDARDHRRQKRAASERQTRWEERIGPLLTPEFVAGKAISAEKKS